HVVGVLSAFDLKFNKLEEEYRHLNQAKEALALAVTADPRLGNAMNELDGLKSTWTELSRVWQALFELRDQPWAAVLPRKTQQTLHALIDSLKTLPNRLRQYASYEHLLATLKGLAASTPLLAGLKSEAFKERHWKLLQKQLHQTQEGVRGSLLPSTGHPTNESILLTMNHVTQGEMGLEQFLRHMQDEWQDCRLELVVYQNKCRLVKGWDNLFTKLKEHLNSLHGMRHSPFYRVWTQLYGAHIDITPILLLVTDICGGRRNMGRKVDCIE
ncbi:hypothetical protein Zmor_011816, partial [Zophobas morio]